MSVCCKEYISFAEDCLKRDDEIGYRNAIARAYYGCYHALVLASGYASAYGETSHQGLINYLNPPPAKGSVLPKLTLISLRARLIKQKDLRVKCDYHLKESIDKDEAESMLEKAKLFIEDIEKFIPLPNASTPNPQPQSNH